LGPIVATKIWRGHPLRQFMTAYKFRVTLVPLLDVLMLLVVRRAHRNGHHHGSFVASLVFWSVLVLSTAASAIANTLQFNAQMTFFAHRVDPAIGGSYSKLPRRDDWDFAGLLQSCESSSDRSFAPLTFIVTLLNTAANLGGTWPSSFVMWLVSRLTPVGKQAHLPEGESLSVSAEPRGNDPYFAVQFVFTLLGLGWIWFFGPRVSHVAALPDDAWRTHLLDGDDSKGKENVGGDGIGFGNGSYAIGTSDTGSSNTTAASTTSSSAVDVELGGVGGGYSTARIRAGGKRE